MSGSIRLHKDFGLNPTLSKCFWCGGDKNEIALLGAAYKGEAPMRMILDYEPCDKCKEGMASGITCIEASRTPLSPGQPPMQRDVYPTGSWSVLTEDAVNRIFEGSEMLAQMLEQRKAFMEQPMYQQLFAPENVEGAKDGQGS